MKSCIRPAVHQVVFTDVQITIRRRVAVLPLLGICQSFVLIGLHKIDAASDWLLIKRHYLGKKGLPGVQVWGLSNIMNYEDMVIWLWD
jgi:hypothetical protein